ncbi:hypothetical protein GCM10027612_22210 [Microbispora bryophytorum subsp. camponoti]
MRDFIAATAPIRNEPCSEANSRLVMLGPDTVGSSTIANRVLGNLGAMRASAGAYE